MMVFVNDAITWETKPVSVLREFLILLQPFAPHLAEELWAKVQSPKSKVMATESQPNLDIGLETLDLAYRPWPKFDPALLVESEVEIPVQVDGKLRGKIVVPKDATKEVYLEIVKKDGKIQEYLHAYLIGREIKKEIVVPNRMVSIVTGVAPGGG